MDKDNTSSNKKSSIPSLIVNVGTYEGRVYSFKFSPTTKTIKEKFSFTVSANTLRVIYHHDSFLFVSGTDEVIHMFDLNKKTSDGDLVTYSGSINDIKVCNNWLIACGDEPTIPLWRMSDFNNIISMKGHKGPVVSADIHHKGAFLVSCGRDKSIILFDMLTGRKIEKFETEYLCNKIELFHKSKFLIAVFDLHIYIFDLMKSSTDKNENIVQKIDFKSKILNAFVIKNKLIIIFTEGVIRVYDLLFEEKVYKPFDTEKYTEVKLECPERASEYDLEIKPRFVSIARSEKVKMLTVVFTNNEICLFDLNKIMKMPNKEKGSEEVTIIKKFYKINVMMKEKITCLDSEFTDK